MNKGFTLIELLVAIAITAILSSIVMYSVSQYINTSKDASISGNLATLIPAGEVWYNSGNSYDGFCDSDVVIKAFSQMPSLPAGPYCKAISDKWAACAQKFRDVEKSYCVDSRGVQKEISNSDCLSSIATCP